MPLDFFGIQFKDTKIKDKCQKCFWRILLLSIINIFIFCFTKCPLQGSLLRSNQSPETEVSTQPNREITAAITQRQCEDIPGMLLFDSNLLCVDGLIDADDLGGKKRKANERNARLNSVPNEKNKNNSCVPWRLQKKAGVEEVDSEYQIQVNVNQCLVQVIKKKKMLARPNILLLQTPTDTGDM